MKKIKEERNERVRKQEKLKKESLIDAEAKRSGKKKDTALTSNKSKKQKTPDRDNKKDDGEGTNDLSIVVAGAVGHV